MNTVQAFYHVRLTPAGYEVMTSVDRETWADFYGFLNKAGVKRVILRKHHAGDRPVSRSNYRPLRVLR